MDTLTVSGAGEPKTMSPNARCGASTYDQVTAGYDQVSATLYDLAK